METYKKPPLNYTEQVALLQSRGMSVPDIPRAERLLANISYYRLSAYMLPYKKKENGTIIDSFKEGTTWDMVYDLYVFDRKLRLLVFDAIERLEIAIRTQIIYQLSHKYGSHWQDNPSIFKAPERRVLRDGSIVTFDVYAEIQKHISDQLHSNRAEVFIQHYRNKYDNPVNPPFVDECGNHVFQSPVTHLYGIEEQGGHQRHSRLFGLPPKTFCSWLHTMNYVRNLCAHHARLWNREMSIVPEKLHFSKRLVWISNPDTVQRGKVYYFFCMLGYLLQTANPTSSFKDRLKTLVDEYKGVASLSAMGFAEGWENEKIWK